MINEDLRIHAHKLCREFLSGPWDSVLPSDIQIEPVSGGLSNVLYCCSLPPALSAKQSPPNKILLRFYGQSCDNDSTTGSVIFMLLSERKLGPKLYGVFEGGRLEEFLPARPLTQIEMKTSDISLAIARKMADIHSLEVPIGKNPSWIFDRCEEWIDFINEHSDFEKTLATIQDESRRKIMKEILELDFVKEIKWLREIIARSNSPEVFSHNDLLRGNILLHEESDKFKTYYQRLVIIDFEYCSYNYRGFDIACHFCEWCFDYTLPDTQPFGDVSYFPSEEEQRNFVHEYLDQSRTLSNRTLVHDLTRDSVEAYKLSKDYSNDRLVSSASYDDTSANNYTNIDCELVKAQSVDPVKKPSTINKKFSLFQTNSIWDRSKDIYNQTNNESNLPDTSIVANVITRQDEDLLLEEIQPFIQAAHMLWSLWAIKNSYCSEIDFDYWKMAIEKLKFYADAKTDYQRKHEN